MYENLWRQLLFYELIDNKINLLTFKKNLTRKKYLEIISESSKEVWK